jgi:ribosome-binding factor A
MSHRRTQRLSDLLKEELSSVLRYRMQDPRLSMCSITEVVLSSDYRHARVYVSVIGPAKRREECLAALDAASGFIRKELRRLDLKFIPSLVFFPDTGAEYSQHIEELLKSVKKDEEPEE